MFEPLKKTVTERLISMLEENQRRAVAMNPADFVANTRPRKKVECRVIERKRLTGQ